MGVKLRRQNLLSIPVEEMKDGDLAIITDSVSGRSNGNIVQRYNNILIAIGQRSEMSWLSVFEYPDSKMRVKILSPGTLIEVI